MEINTREHFAVRGHHRRAVRVDNPWFSGEADVVTFALEELLGTKLRALYQRKKGRDLFDLARALEAYPALDRAKVVACFRAYTKHGATPCSRAEFERNLAEKEADGGFLRDVHALLAVQPEGAVDRGGRASEAYDASEALEIVRREFVRILPGDPWRGAT